MNERSLFSGKRFVPLSLIVVGLGLFGLALLVDPEGVSESVWTGIATGLFTTGLIESALVAIGARERTEEMERRKTLLKPLDYYDPVIEGEPLATLAIPNNGDEVAVHVVVATHFPRDLGLIYTSHVQRSLAWAPATFDQATGVRKKPELMEALPWQSLRVPIEFEHIPPDTHPRVYLRPVGAGPPAQRVEAPVRVAWSVPGDPFRYSWDFEFIFEPDGSVSGRVL